MRFNRLSRHWRSFAPVLLCLLPTAVGGQEVITTPHIDDTAAVRSVSLHGETYIHHGLVGTGVLSANTVDFLGDTLGSFSSLAMAPGSWRRVGNGYEGVLWTLPDRGRNDPSANVFYDYSARLERMRIRFTPDDGRVTLVPEGGLVLRDFDGRRFTGADPGTGTVTQRGMTLPAPSSGVGQGKVSLDAESLQFTRDGHFYIGDEYSANVYYFDRQGRLRGVIQPPAAVAPRRAGQPFFGSLDAPESGRRNNQGIEGLSLSPDGRTLIVALQSALIQDSANGSAAGRVNTRVLVYDVARNPTPQEPSAHYVVQLPAYSDNGQGGAANRTAAQSEIRAIDAHRFLMLARDGAGVGADNDRSIVYKSIMLIDTTGATNLHGTPYETDTASVLQSPRDSALRADITPAHWVELVNMLNPTQLARFGLSVGMLSEKWEAMDLVSTLDRDQPNAYFLIVGNDNDFIARRCRMSGAACDSSVDNDNRILIYRLSLPAPLR